MLHSNRSEVFAIVMNDPIVLVAADGREDSSIIEIHDCAQFKTLRECGEWLEMMWAE